MGPERASDAIRKALSMGAHKAVHPWDEALHGSDAPSTARALAKVVATLDGVELVTIERETDAGIVSLEASVPAVVSVTEKINEPRYPSFKGIMAAKKKPVSVVSLAEAGIDAAELGLANAASQVVASAATPPKAAGQKVTDEGEGGVAVFEFLADQKLL